MKGAAVPVFLFFALACGTIAGALLGFTVAVAVMVFRWLT